ncbi:MAG: ion transporter [Alphaproteobacteria bacterium]|nr:ion transporter [Alphaproteobacteria bacterium]MBU0799211.1 ion transporter [Alphaproteobacteria bacterium]MBU0887538.1 ion transporter [Alphaproteobacteria bacterium]MBU1814775.1 ion transporter [Alphaproteobacteria bacterium]
MDRLKAVIESNGFQNFIIAVIILNAVTLGLETSATAMSVAGPVLGLLDRAALAVFVIELLLKLLVYRLRFFRDAWNVFDFLIVTVTLIPAGQSITVLRSLRILRALRLISVFPSMRKVVQALLRAIPGMGSVVALLSLVYYVAAVMATKLFSASFPEWFGTIGASTYSLFQIMTLESWSMGIVRPVMEVYPQAWIFFITFILLTTFAVLNLFIAIIVDAMTQEHQEEEEATRSVLGSDHDQIMAELRALRGELAEMRGQNRV